MPSTISMHTRRICTRVVGSLCLALCAPAQALSLTWTRVQELPAADIETLELHGTTLYAAGSDTVYRGMGDGTTWTPSNPVGAGGAPILTVTPAGGALWVGTFGHGVFRSPDDGLTWDGINNGLAGLGADHITGFAERDDTLFAATEGAGVFALELGTPVAWAAFNEGLPVFTSGSVSSILLHGTTLVAPAGPNGLIYRYPAGATEWQEVALRPPLLPGFLATDIYSDGLDLLVTDGTSLYHSADDGQTWTLAGAGLPNGTAVFLANAGSTIFAVVDFPDNTHQLYSSTDTGVSWQPIETVADAFVYGIEVAGDRLFVARTDGLWWTPTTATDVRSVSWGRIKARFPR